MPKKKKQQKLAIAWIQGHMTPGYTRLNAGFTQLQEQIHEPPSAVGYARDIESIRSEDSQGLSGMSQA